MKKSEAYAKLRSLIKGDVIPMKGKPWTTGTHNEHGNKVGTRGLTGTHEHGETYLNSSIHPRPQGGVMVLVSGDLYDPDGDEFRFKTKKDAVNYLNSLPKRTQDQRNNIPF